MIPHAPTTKAVRRGRTWPRAASTPNAADTTHADGAAAHADRPDQFVDTAGRRQ